MQVSVVITVLNEAHSLPALCRALATQTKHPHAVIIIDGGSSDRSLAVLKQCQVQYPQLPLRVLINKGNRSVGRNAGISAAETDWIAITDAGCEPTPTWLAELCTTQAATLAPVVAGYYRGLATTPLAEAVIPYVLVMPDQVDPTNFLPATRSMLLKKAVWRQLGGFDETLSHNEDYAFARRLQANKYQIAFAQNAIVLWHPRTTLKSFIVMIYRFAIGDAESGCYRPKVGLVFLRYLLVKVGVMLLALTSGAALAGWVLLGVFLLYSCWAVLKNYRYAQNGWYWLPVLQYCADGAVMVGTAIGLSRALIRPRR